MAGRQHDCNTAGLEVHGIGKPEVQGAVLRYAGMVYTWHVRVKNHQMIKKKGLSTKIPLGKTSNCHAASANVFRLTW